MRKIEAIRGLHIVTDYNAVAQAPIPHDLVRSVEMVLEGGANVIQMRYKAGTTEQRITLGRQLLPLTNKYQTLLIINDDVRTALEIDADGVHIGRDDGVIDSVRKEIGPHRILGVSVNTVKQAREAEAAGADYVGVTVYPSKNQAGCKTSRFRRPKKN